MVAASLNRGQVITTAADRSDTLQSSVVRVPDITVLPGAVTAVVVFSVSYNCMKI